MKKFNSQADDYYTSSQFLCWLTYNEIGTELFSTNMRYDLMMVLECKDAEIDDQGLCKRGAIFSLMVVKWYVDTTYGNRIEKEWWTIAPYSF